MIQRSRNFAYLGALFAIAGAIISALLVCKHSFPDLCQSSMGCDINGTDGCKALGQTSYAHVFGIPIAAFGFFYYATVLVTFLRIAILEKSSKMLGSVVFLGAVGVFVDIVLGVINLGILDTPCILCIYTYITTAGVMIMAGLLFRSEVKASKEKPSAAIDWASLVVHSIVGLVITILLYGCYSVMSPTTPAAQAGVPLVEPSEVDQIISDFNTLPEAPMNVNGINTTEGGDGAYIVIHEFADFLCPHCRHTTHMIADLMKRWPGRIKVYYRQFPLDGTCNPMIQGVRKPFGDWRCNAAQAAVCAGGMKNFSEYYHDVFELQMQDPPAMTPETLKPIAEKHGLNWDQVYACMGSARSQQLINADINAGKTAEINSTPLVILNNRILSRGSPHEPFFFHVIDSMVYKKEGQAAFDELKKRMQEQ
ncbi:MAG: thioredoxin domain-containing protein [Leptospiraceae bacterium]|nr:thioredoxin domain-containing protein [Leptospiraceae bacterium]MCB1304075.1 thioredoxin domain-containing protein [Leptospiraceae bacterium]